MFAAPNRRTESAHGRFAIRPVVGGPLIGRVRLGKPRVLAAGRELTPVAVERFDAPRARAELDQLYRHFATDVRRWVRAFGVRRADIEDLVQEVFVIAFRRYDTARGENPKAWLYQIARRKVRGYRRLAWIRHVVVVESLAPLEGLTPDVQTPARRAEAREQVTLISRVLGRLSEAQQLAFVLVDLEGRSGEEIARLQNVPLNTVWTRVYRARRAVRDASRRLDAPSPRTG
ncbi:MAG: RNA polymerase sigma factor [Myxococcales bacterium]|nr:MAG: RNA polymerase sigma factor [Myxococcales bacterium]